MFIPSLMAAVNFSLKPLFPGPTTLQLAACSTKSKRTPSRRLVNTTQTFEFRFLWQSSRKWINGWVGFHTKIMWEWQHVFDNHKNRQQTSGSEQMIGKCPIRLLIVRPWVNYKGSLPSQLAPNLELSKVYFCLLTGAVAALTWAEPWAVSQLDHALGALFLLPRDRL
jgi:hypothetical protein